MAARYRSKDLVLGGEFIMADKKQITVNLDENSLAKMDKLCKNLNMNRAQVLRLLFSGNVQSVQFVCEALVSIENGLFGGTHDI